MKEFFKNNIVRLFLGLSLVLNLGLFLFFYFLIKQSNIPIVLHYNVDWGVDYLGEVKSIFTLPIIGFLIFLFNGVLAMKLWVRNKALSYFLTIVILLVEIFLGLGGIALYIINS